ncbi:MAG: dTMP kinase [Phycisphaerales bacterium]
MHGWLKKLAGRFLVFEGPDGSGKSTQFKRLADACREAGVAVTEVREPGGTGVGERIREVLLDPANDDMEVRCEMLLYMASRAQLIEQTIRPALKRGELVLADRFIASTLAYQGAAGGLDVASITAVARVAVGNLWPEVNLLFDVDDRTAAGRLNPLLDRMEQKGVEFHRRVRDGYLQQASADPLSWMVIDATRSVDDVTGQMMRGLQDRFAGGSGGGGSLGARVTVRRISSDVAARPE